MSLFFFVKWQLHRVVIRIKWNNKCEAFRTVLSTQKRNAIGIIIPFCIFYYYLLCINISRIHRYQAWFPFTSQCTHPFLSLKGNLSLIFQYFMNNLSALLSVTAFVFSQNFSNLFWIPATPYLALTLHLIHLQI